MTDTLFRWDDSFLIGIKELDHEHKILIEDINKLHEKLAGSDEMSEIRKCLGDICARMQAHFALEEHVMKEHDYEFFDEHKREHDEFLEDYTEYMMRFLNAPSISLKNPIEECLRQWVVGHIATSDKKMSLIFQEEHS
ncbi:MAG: bacteriohemerythrin [Woeseiaceae bacterium]|nr:bacteriohemerythrin [Woeseiaceae bacterium]